MTEQIEFGDETYSALNFCKDVLNSFRPQGPEPISQGKTCEEYSEENNCPAFGCSNSGPYHMFKPSKPRGFRLECTELEPGESCFDSDSWTVNCAECDSFGEPGG